MSEHPYQCVSSKLYNLYSKFISITMIASNNLVLVVDYGYQTVTFPNKSHCEIHLYMNFCQSLWFESCLYIVIEFVERFFENVPNLLVTKVTIFEIYFT